jgi:uncharacterized membrane protein YfcA
MVFPLWFIGAALITEVMAAVVGFGSSTLLTPLAAFVFDIKTALAVVAVFHATGALVRFLAFERSVDWPFFRQFGIPAIVFALIGAYLVRSVSSTTLLVLLGLFLLLFVLFSLFRPKFRLPRPGPFEEITGALTGFFSGFLGSGGALRAAALQGFGMEKEAYAGTAALVALTVDLTRIPVYFASGYFGGIEISTLTWLALLAILGTGIGVLIIHKIPHQVFRIIVLLAVAAVAIKLIVSGLGYG